MKPIVIDASVAAAWVLPDESSDAALALYAQATDESDVFHAPLLWTWETGNLLAMAARCRRIQPEQVEQGLELLGAAQIGFDAPMTPHRQAQTARMAQTHGLTFYDASYLELVLRLNGQLASLDQQLLAAARTCGIVCLTV